MLDSYHARPFLTMCLAGRLLADSSEPTLPPWLWHQMGGDVQADCRPELALLAA
jgi:hypothetical protein